MLECGNLTAFIYTAVSSFAVTARTNKFELQIYDGRRHAAYRCQRSADKFFPEKNKSHRRCLKHLKVTYIRHKSRFVQTHRLVNVKRRK